MRYIFFALLFCLCVPLLPVSGQSERFVNEITGEADDAGNSYFWQRSPIYFNEDESTPEEEAFLLFSSFFQRAAYGVPDDVRVLSVSMDDGCLMLNVSGEILCYGGNANESALVTQIMINAAELPQADRLTLLVDGRIQSLPEGRVLDEMPLR